MDTLSVRIPINVLSETWFSSDTVFNLQSYNGYHSYRGERRGGGVSIYVSVSIRSSEVTALSINDGVLDICCVKGECIQDYEIYYIGSLSASSLTMR